MTREPPRQDLVPREARDQFYAPVKRPCASGDSYTPHLN
jgi:hypothetical protein